VSLFILVEFGFMDLEFPSFRENCPAKSPGLFTHGVKLPSFSAKVSPRSANISSLVKKICRSKHENFYYSKQVPLFLKELSLTEWRCPLSEHHICRSSTNVPASQGKFPSICGNSPSLDSNPSFRYQFPVYLQFLFRRPAKIKASC